MFTRVCGSRSLSTCLPKQYNTAHKEYKLHIMLNKKISDKANSWRELLSFVHHNGASFNHVNWATTMSKLGRRLPTLNGKDRQELQKSKHYQTTIDALSKAITSPSLHQLFGTREVANIVHALAKLKQPDAAILAAVNDQSEHFVSNGTPQELANMAWAFAELSNSTNSTVDCSLLFRTIESRANFIVAEGSPQATANTAWAFATLAIPAPSLFAAISDRAKFLASNGKPQEIANTAWAAATLYSRVRVKVNRNTTSQTPMICQSLFREIEKNARTLMTGNTQEIATTAWAFGKLKYDSPALLAAVDGVADVIVARGSTQSANVVALAFAESGHKPANFFKCLEARKDDFARAANSQEINNVSWSLVTLGLAQDHKPLLRALWARSMSVNASEHTTDGLKQLAQVDLHARASGVELRSVPAALKKRMIAAVAKNDRPTSSAEDDWSGLLSEAGFKHEREVQFLGGGYGDFMAIDFACKERKVAVEFDGPSHYLNELGEGARANWGREDGRTTAKRRLLEQMGWRVVNVSYKDAIKLDNAPKEEVEKAGGVKEMKLKYLRNRLKQADVAII